MNKTLYDAIIERFERDAIKHELCDPSDSYNYAVMKINGMLPADLLYAISEYLEEQKS